MSILAGYLMYAILIVLGLVFIIDAIARFWSLNTVGKLVVFAALLAQLPALAIILIYVIDWHKSRQASKV